MKLVYIGKRFYQDSNTAISCLYTEDRQRSSWVKVENALEEGDTIEIRQPTEDEVAFYNKKLDFYYERLNTIQKDLAGLISDSATR